MRTDKMLSQVESTPEYMELCTAQMRDLSTFMAKQASERIRTAIKIKRAIMRGEQP